MLNNSAYLSDLSDSKYQLLLDSQDVAAVLESIAVPEDFDLIVEELTGLVVFAADGEYKEVWATDSSKPYHINSSYTQLL